MAENGCPDRDTLQRFLLGDLSEVRMRRVSLHLDACVGCAAALESLDPSCDTFLELLRSYDDSLCDEDGFHRLQEQLAAYYAAGASEAPSLSAGDPAGDASPTTLGNYELGELLGRGAMGAVYLARHTRLNRVVAVKLLDPKRTDDPDLIGRFSREMEALGRLEDHPHVVKARDAGEHDGRHYLVMEHVAGIDLGRLLRVTGPVRVADACEVVRQAALGLAHAHRSGLLHRDVKPSNLMLTRTGTVKLLDLGLAAARGRLGAGDAIAGTADYMAPEQWNKDAVLDERADLYALGCTFYKLLVGSAPFAHAGASARKKRRAHQSAKFAPPGQCRDDLPAEVGELLTRMLAKAPAARPASADEVAESLREPAGGCDLAALAALATDADEDTHPGRGDATLAQQILGTLRTPTRRRWLYASAGAGLLAATGLWGFVAARRSPYELLMAQRPQFVRSEFNAHNNSLQTYSTGVALFAFGSVPGTSYRLSSRINPLDRDVSAGLFFGLFNFTDKGRLITQFDVIGFGAAAAGGVDVYHARYLVASETEPVIWEHHPIASAWRAPDQSRPVKRLELVVQNGSPVGVTLDGKNMGELLTPTERDGREPTGTERCGVFSTDGAALFHDTKLQAV